MTATIRPVQPAAAIAALFARGLKLDPSFSWQDVSAEEHARAFTVAKSAGFDVLVDIHEALVAAASEGKTEREFSRDLTPILQAKGWWGRRDVVDPETGETVTAQLGSLRRLRTIFQTNLRVSYAAGHWAAFERQKLDRPWLRYVAILDRKTRPEHAARHNLCLPVDHPYWDTWAPPCGWNCRCTLQSLSDRDVERMRSQLRFEPPMDTMRTWTNRRTGETVTIPVGIDPGWGHNPGKLRHQAQAAAADRWTDAPPPLARAAAEPTETVEALADAFEAWARSPAPERTRMVVGTLPEAAAPSPEASAAIAVDATVVRAALAPRSGPPGLTAAVAAAVLRLPAVLAQPMAIVRERASGVLLHVFEVAGERDRVGVVRVVQAATAGRPASIAAIDLIDPAALADDAVYETLDGQVTRTA